MEQLTNEATKLSESDNTGESLEKFQSALRLARECQQGGDIYGTCLFNTGVCMVTLERYGEALDVLKELLSIWSNALESEEQEKIRMFADAHSHMATCCYAQNRSGEAVTHLRQALVAYEAMKPNIKTEIAMICQQLALRLQEQSRYSEALDFIQRVIECAREVGDHQLVANSYREKALILARNKNLTDATDSLELAQICCDKIEEKSTQSSTYSSLGDACISIKMSDKAAVCYTKALDALRIANNSQTPSSQSEEASLLQNIGAARNLMEDYDGSLSFHREAMALYASLGQRQKQVHCMLNLGFACTKLEQYGEATAVLLETRDLSDKCHDKEMEFSVLENLGTAQFCDRKFAEAVESFQKALCAIGCVSQLTSGARTDEVSQRIVGKLSDAISMREQEKTKKVIKQNASSSSFHSNHRDSGDDHVTTESHLTSEPSSSKRHVSYDRVHDGAGTSHMTTAVDENEEQEEEDEGEEEESTDMSGSEESESEVDEPALSASAQSPLPNTLSGGPTIGTKLKLEQRFKHFESLSDDRQMPATPVSHSTPRLKTVKQEEQPEVNKPEQKHVIVREGSLATGENQRRVGGSVSSSVSRQRQVAMLETVSEDNGSVDTQTTVETKTSSICVIL